MSGWGNIFFLGLFASMALANGLYALSDFMAGHTATAIVSLLVCLASSLMAAVHVRAVWP